MNSKFDFRIRIVIIPFGPTSALVHGLYIYDDGFFYSVGAGFESKYRISFFSCQTKTIFIGR